MAPKIHTPVKGYSGEVVGVAFSRGVGETEDPAAIAYFRRRGYEIADEATGGSQGGKQQEPPQGDPSGPDGSKSGNGEGGPQEPTTGDDTGNGDGASGDGSSGDGGSDDKRPAGNASRDTWVEYALAQGKTEDDLTGLKQTEIRALFDTPDE